MSAPQTSRQSLRGIWQDFKTDMFSFKRVKEASVVATFSATLDKALNQPHSTEKVEQLLAVQEEAQAAMKDLTRPQRMKMLLFGGLAIVGSAVGLPLVGDPATTLILLPVIAPAMKYMHNTLRAFLTRVTIKEAVNAEVREIAEANPSHVFASPTVQEKLVDKGVLLREFSTVTDNPREEYAKLQPKPAAAALNL